MVSVAFDVVLDVLNLVGVSPWLAEDSDLNQSVASLKDEFVVHASDDLLVYLVDLTQFLLVLFFVGSSGSFNRSQEGLFTLKCRKLTFVDFAKSTDHLNH